MNDPLTPEELPASLPQLRPDDAYRHGLFFTLGVATIAFGLFIGYKILGAVLAVGTPFVGAIVLSLMLEPVVRLAQTRLFGGNRMRAVSLVFFVLLSVIGGTIAYAGPVLVQQTQNLIRFFTPVTYIVSRSTGDKNRFVTVADGIADTSFTIKNLVNRAEYRFVVYAVNADGAKSPSPIAATIPRENADMADPAPAKTPTTGADATPLEAVSIPAQSPQSLTAHPGDGSVRLTWRPPVQGQSGFDLLRGNADKWLAGHQKIGPVTLPKNLDALAAQYSDQVSQALQLSASRLTTVITSSLGSLATALLIPVIAVFILADMDRLRARTYLFMPDAMRRFTQTTVGDIGEVFGKYLRGLFILCSIYSGFAITYLFVLSFWFPGLRGYALLLGVLGGVLYAVPYLGAATTAILTIIAALSTGCGVGGAVAAVGGLAVLNTIWDYVMVPKVIGKSAGVHPLLITFALFMGGNLLGLWGMLLAVPMAASVQGILFRLYPQLAAPTPLSLLLAERKHVDDDVATPTVPATPPTSER